MRHATATHGSSGGPALTGRMLRFALVGGSGVLVNLLLLALLVEMAGWHYLAAAVVAIEASTLSNWALNRAWTWRDRQSAWTSVLPYHGVTAVGMLVQWSTLWLVAGAFGQHYVVGTLGGVALATAWNFFANDRISFAPLAHLAQNAHRRRIALRVVAALLYIAVAVVFTHPWDTFVFQRSTGDFLATGTTPYDTAAESPDYIFAGGSLPLQAQWYAYPPLPLLLMVLSYAPAELGTVPAWAGRLLIKLPFLVGTYAFALAARRLVAGPDTPGAPSDAEARTALADRVERWILFNPLILVVTAIWGQFEGLVLLLLLFMVLALRKGHVARAGLAFGGALLLKMLPVYIGPLLVAHIWRTRGPRALVRFAGAGALLFTLVSLPFALLQWEGFYQQVVGMHAGRPPARFSPISGLYWGLRGLGEIGWVPAWDPVALVAPLSLLSFVLTAAVVGLLTLASLNSRPTERALLWWMGLVLAGGLLSTKVLNEQYVLLPLGLLALARFHPGASDASVPGTGRLLTAASWAVAFAGIVDNFHFLTFLPDDVARAVLGVPVPVAIARMSWALGLSQAQLKLILDIATGLVLLVPFSLALRVLTPRVVEGARVAARLSQRLVPQGGSASRAAFAPMAVLLLIVPVAAGILGADERPFVPPPDGLTERSVVALYRTDWYNPLHDPDKRSGNWIGARTVPVEGFYNPNARHIVDDLTTMRGHGVTSILLSYDPLYEPGAVIADGLADDLGIPHGLFIDLTRLAGRDGRVPLSHDTVTGAARMVRGPGLDFWHGPCVLSDPSDGHAVLMVSGTARLGHAFSRAEHTYVLETYLEQAAPPPDDTLVSLAAAAPPLSRQELALDAPHMQLWRDAYALADENWWRDVLRDVPVPLALIGDAGGDRLPVLPGPHRWWGTTQEGVDDLVHIAPIGDGPVDPEGYRRAWSQTAAQRPHAVLVPWNEHDRGRAIEPTREHGDLLLLDTAVWADWFQAAERT